MEFKCLSRVTYFLHEIPFASIIMKEMIINDEIGFFLEYSFLNHFLLFSQKQATTNVSCWRAIVGYCFFEIFLAAEY